jgi:hypothetical protein
MILLKGHLRVLRGAVRVGVMHGERQIWLSGLRVEFGAAKENVERRQRVERGSVLTRRRG